MKGFWIIIVLLLTVAAVAGQKNDANNPAQVKGNDSNDSNSGKELLNVMDVEGPNVPQGYIGGDAFNLTFAPILKEYVNQQGLVNYPKMRRFRAQLDDAIERFANLPPEVYITWSQSEKIAFWMNAYNICTLKAVIDNYPIKPSRFMLLFYPANSVMHIQGIRDKTYFMIMGIQYTLVEIERDVLLGRFEEPRVLFAISYATMSSAGLRPEPYLGKVLEKQFDEQAKNYFASPNGFRIDEASKVVYLSPIFKMYQWHEDSLLKRYGTNQLFRQFQPVDRAVLNFVKDYISPANADFLKKKEYSIEYIRYDWQLNEQPAE
ncbi:MAG: DUF547 domain-containing protein [Phycisphaerae bacterium]|nr:DUF547 domain-containing protein [Phycisphaerae bacterium]